MFFMLQEATELPEGAGEYFVFGVVTVLFLAGLAYVIWKARFQKK